VVGRGHGVWAVTEGDTSREPYRPSSPWWCLPAAALIGSVEAHLGPCIQAAPTDHEHDSLGVAEGSPTDGGRGHPHDLRHCFASVQIRAGRSIKVFQSLLGHKSEVETWDTYGHLMGDEDDRSRTVVEEALGNPDRSTSAVDPRWARHRRSARCEG
jgi:hypothetical protein